MKELKNKRDDFKKVKQEKKILLRETWAQKKISMKLKIREAKSNLMIMRLEYKKLIKEMKNQNKINSMSFN